MSDNPIIEAAKIVLGSPRYSDDKVIELLEEAVDFMEAHLESMSKQPGASITDDK